MKLRVIFPAVILMVVLALIVQTLGFSFKSKVFPLTMAVPLAVLVAVQLVRETRSDEVIKDKFTGRQYLMVGLWIGAFLLSFYLFGFLVGMPLFNLVYVRLHRFSWLKTAICTALVAAMALAFYFALSHVDWYQGAIIELIKG